MALSIEAAICEPHKESGLLYFCPPDGVSMNFLFFVQQGISQCHKIRCPIFNNYVHCLKKPLATFAVSSKQKNSSPMLNCSVRESNTRGAAQHKQSLNHCINNTYSKDSNLSLRAIFQTYLLEIRRDFNMWNDQYKQVGTLRHGNHVVLGPHAATYLNIGISYRNSVN